MTTDRVEFGGVSFTVSEFEVLKLAVKGYTNDVIASRLFYKPKSIEHMLSTEAKRGIYEKIGVKDRRSASEWYRDVVEQIAIAADLNEQVLMINKVRSRGDPNSAIEMCEHALRFIERQLSRRSNSASHRKNLEETLGRLKFQKVIAFQEISHPHTIREVVRPVVDDIMSIAEAHNNSELYGLAYYVAGDGHYILGRHNESIRHLKLGIVKTTNNDFKLSILRTSALSSAFLHDQNQFVQKSDQINHLIKSGNCTDLPSVCAAYEGIGRGRSILGMHAAMDAVSKGMAVYSKIAEKDKAPLRSVQLKRTEIEILRKSEPHNYALIERKGKDCILLAKAFGYPRYVTQMEKLLNNHLNQK